MMAFPNESLTVSQTEIDQHAASAATAQAVQLAILGHYGVLGIVSLFGKYFPVCSDFKLLYCQKKAILTIGSMP